MTWSSAKECKKVLSNWAVDSLIQEAELTPKPGLVDPGDQGAHLDMSFAMMVKSAHSLRETFSQIAEVSYNRKPSQELREEIAEIGREGEKVMMEATKGVNTHKGAIWVLGLLTSGTAVNKPGEAVPQIVETASIISRYNDRRAPLISSHGSEIHKKFGVKGARGEAVSGFPRIINVALPMLYQSRKKGISEDYARLDTLVNLIACLDDTCIIHRGGLAVLYLIQEKAQQVLQCGGVSTSEGWSKLEELNQTLLKHNASPGGSADLLAAVLYLDQLRNDQNIIEKKMATI
ncbi:triphosphoribosyl-dephospho-CoA synthase [Halobacillus sp. Marseille-Q1614]|uniref:triphosphoribosyl-dephospho-CoA synthase n=1 Tax=Halobacillus sp. Marseille-Q1614 TaxID=2709134 RepID=UPI001570AD77|nr:triphosphoribosyl-dephospho-CoA synthase [Halobacillus sp. Marseille-Q1614]